jgi:excisionase family DNA binding protein
MSDLPRILTDLDRAIAETTPAEAPALALALAARLAGLAARSMNGDASRAVPPQAPGELLTVAEAAERLKVPVEWIYRRSRRLPFTVRLGARGLRVSPAKLEAYIRQRGASVS